MISRRFTFAEISFPERAARLAKLSPESKALWLGAEALKASDRIMAEAYFKHTGELAPFLLAKLDKLVSETAEALARNELLSILASCGFKVKSLPGPDEFPELAAWISLPPASAQRTAADLEAFLRKNAKTATAQLYDEAVKTVIRKLEERAETPELRWSEIATPLAERATPSAIKTINDLNKALMRINPLYFGGGDIELSPDGGFNVDLSGQKVKSLEPFRGLAVKTLLLNSCPISDLRPLKGMPLENLQFVATEVTDIKTLDGMHLKCIAFDPAKLSERDDLQILRRMKSLETIGVPQDGKLKFRTAQEFWHDLDGSQQQPMPEQN